MQMSAFRPEAFRFLRLASVYRDLERNALGGDHSSRWSEAISAIDDSKGDITLTWRSAEDIARFSCMADEAWAALGEATDRIVHVLSSPPFLYIPEDAFAVAASAPAPLRVEPAVARRIEIHPPSLGVGLLLGALAFVGILGIR